VSLLLCHKIFHLIFIFQLARKDTALLTPFQLASPLPSDFGYLFPFFTTEYYFVQKIPDPATQAFNLLYSFDMPTWLLVVLSTFMVSVTFTLAGKLHSKVHELYNYLVK